VKGSETVRKGRGNRRKGIEGMDKERSRGNRTVTIPFPSDSPSLRLPFPQTLLPSDSPSLRLSFPQTPLPQSPHNLPFTLPISFPTRSKKLIPPPQMPISHFFTYKTHIKLRWKNRPLIEVLVSEFRTRTKEYYLGAIEAGVISVNEEKVKPEYKLKDLDIIYHTVHSHEPTPMPIEIIKDEGDYVVVNKPAGIPVHPTGGYHYYSVTKSLFPNETVGCINRLDMPVSGVLIIVRRNHKEAFGMIGGATKVYVAKVRGEFPSGETKENEGKLGGKGNEGKLGGKGNEENEGTDNGTISHPSPSHSPCSSQGNVITVNEPIGKYNGTFYDVKKGGKESKTEFRRLKYQNGYSLVECRPITGRTHQIRIHLKHLGYPIVNDLLYNKGEGSENMRKKESGERESSKGTSGCISASDKETSECPSDKETSECPSDKETSECPSSNEAPPPPPLPCSISNKQRSIDNPLACDLSPSKAENEKMKFIVAQCRGENNRSFQAKDSFICLHAWKYVYGGREYESEWPQWSEL